MSKSRLGLGIGLLAGLLGTPLVAHAEPMVGLKVAGATQALVTFDSATPGTVSADKAIVGLDAGDVIASIDLRPDTGVLYGLSQSGKLYTLTVNANDVTATKVGMTPATVGGSSIGIDFNPAADRVRVVSNTRENFRINPNDGVPATPADGQLTYASGGNCLVPDLVNFPQIIGVAYRNSFGGAVGFTDAAGSNNGLLQYGIDARTARLVTMGGANLNDGCVQEIGNGLLSGVTTLPAPSFGGFDISPATGTAFASLTAAGTNTLYTINLATGAATSVGNLPSPDIRDVVVLGAPKSATVFAVTKQNQLVKFDAAAPQTFTLAPTAITGLGANENVLGVDFRPATGELYALSVAAGTARVYKINKATAAATVLNATGFAVAGGAFGFDFNPAVDAIRIVSDAGKNYRVNPTSGELTNDTDLDQIDGPDSSNTPFGSGVAYTNNVNPKPAGTRLFFIDPAGRSLNSQGSLGDGGAVDGGANGGQLYFVAPTGVQTTNAGDSSVVGFDIAPDGTAYASMTAGTTSRLYEIVLAASGAPAARYGRVIGTDLGANTIVDIAVEVPVPAPTPDAGPRSDAGTSSSSSGSPNIDGGPTVPGSGSGGTEDDGGCDCRTTPSSASGPSALALVIASLWIVRRRRKS